MKRKLVVTFVALLVSFNLAVGYKLLTGNAAADSNTDYFNLTVFTRALQLVRQDYVDEKQDFLPWADLFGAARHAQ